MFVPPNSAIARAIAGEGHAQGGIKFDPDHTTASSAVERQIAKTLVKVIEEAREGRRDSLGQAIYGIGPESSDRVDHMPWDELLGIGEIRECAEQVGTSLEAVLTFVMANCLAGAWDKFFWMRACVEVSSTVSGALDDMTRETVRRLEAEHARQKREADVNRVMPAAVKRRAIGQRTASKVRDEAERLRRTCNKESAAPIIADKIGRSVGSVKRYLTRLYPGAAWDQD